MIKVKLIFFVSVLTLVGCKKDIFDPDNNVGGCTDIDAINFNNEADFEDNSCLYAYIQEYEISYYPDENPNSSIPFVDSWDIPGTGANADLLLKIKHQDSSSYLFVSPIMENQSANSPAYWPAQENYKLVNKTYYWELYDNDATNSNEFIDSGSFNPISIAINNKITVHGNHLPSNSTQLVIHYALGD